MKKTDFLFIILLSIVSCKKNDSDSNTNSNPSERMIGSIVLPNGSPIDLSSCNVVAQFSLSPILKNNTYAIDTTKNNFSAIFLTDQNDQPIMMRYIYPGQQDNDITAQSTALGLFMSLPSVQALTVSAKLGLLPKLSPTSEFNNLVDEVTKKLKLGGSFADGQDSTLNTALNKMFDKAITLKVSGLLDKPISFFTTGNHLSIVNNGIANIYGVGLYKDGQQVGSIQIIGGYDYLPTSLGDIVNHVYAFTTNSLTEEPKDLDFDFKSDGQYELRIRSGGKIGDNTPEATKALNYDLVKGALNLMTLYVPQIEAGQCKTAMIGKLLSYISNTYSTTQLQASSPTTLSRYMANTASYLFTASSDLNLGCVSEKIQSRFFKVIGNFFNYVNIAGAVNSAINLSIVGYQLQNAKPIIDTCFKVSNGIITSCNSIATLTTDPVSSITQTTAVSGGIITNNGGLPIFDRGVVCSLSENPTIGNNLSFPSGEESLNFKSLIFGLTPGKEYFARAYVVNSSGNYYGNQVSFTTLQNDSCDFTFTWGPPPNLQVVTGSHVFMPLNIWQYLTDNETFVVCTPPNGSPPVTATLPVGIHFKMKRGESATITMMWLTTSNPDYCLFLNGTPDTTYVTKSFICQ